MERRRERKRRWEEREEEIIVWKEISKKSYSPEPRHHLDGAGYGDTAPHSPRRCHTCPGQVGWPRCSGFPLPQERDALKEPSLGKKHARGCLPAGDQRGAAVVKKSLSGLSRGRSGELPLPPVLEGESLGAKIAL